MHFIGARSSVGLEHRFCTPEVAGSNPVGSTKQYKRYTLPIDRVFGGLNDTMLKLRQQCDPHLS